MPQITARFLDSKATQITKFMKMKKPQKPVDALSQNTAALNKLCELLEKVQPLLEEIAENHRGHDAFTAPPPKHKPAKLTGTLNLSPQEGVSS